MSTLREILAPSATRRIREHNVLHVAADLPAEDDAIQRARREVLLWAQKRNGGHLPRDAMAGKAFDLLAAGRSTSVAVVDLPEIDAWALRQDDPDKEVPGRIWTSEAVLWQTPGSAPRFAARLIVGSGARELNIAHAAPGYVRQIADNVGLLNGSCWLPSTPWYVGDETGREELFDLLTDPARRLPVVVASAVDRKSPDIPLDLDKIAAGLCGLAYVVAILPDTAWAMTDRFGKGLSVLDRATRIYMPGFREDADPFAHPLWLGARMADQDAAAMVDRQIRAWTAAFSTRMVRLGTNILPFAQLRSVSRQVEQESLAARGATDSEKLSAAENRIAALMKELDSSKALQEYAIDDAEIERRRAEEAEARTRAAVAHVQVLLRRSTDAGGRAEASPPPTSWAELEDWSDLELAGRLALTGAARRGCKNALYADVAQVARCLDWLADECRNRFLNGGGSLRDEAVDGGIRNSPCGGDEFTFDWQGQRLVASWHVKNGGNTRDPIKCLRIYYAWDDRTQQIIVADLPAHRHSGAT